MSGSEIQILETTVGGVAEALAQLRVPKDRLFTVVVQPDDWLTKARQESRCRVAAASLSDNEVDRLIEQARDEVWRQS
jgi:hypothetical protein